MAKKYTVIQEEFSSIESFLNAINNRPVNRVFQRSCDSLEQGRESFFGTKSFDEAVKIIKEGYQKPLEQIKKSMAKQAFKANAVVQRQRPKSSLIGYAPIVPNAILGLPNSMIYTEKVPMKMKAVTIRYSIGVVSDVDLDTIINAGVAILNIINLLELSGYRVKLIVEPKTSVCDGELTCVSINVKDFRDHLDLKKLSFPLSHPSMQRRFGFRWLETTAGIQTNGWFGGYGRSVSHERYETAKKIYEENGLIDKNTYMVNVTMCEEERFDIDRIMERSGIAQVMKKGA